MAELISWAAERAKKPLTTRPRQVRAVCAALIESLDLSAYLADVCEDLKKVAPSCEIARMYSKILQRSCVRHEFSDNTRSPITGMQNYIDSPPHTMSL